MIGESRVMLHTVAKLHYEEDLSQVRIAKLLGLSTATISRMLRRAREEGIVRIEVRDVVDRDEVGEELSDRLGLTQVVAVDAPLENAVLALAPSMERILRECNLTRESVLMIGWGRTVSALLESGLPPLPGISIVGSMGGLQQHAIHFQSNEFARRAAEVTGGVPHFIHAPYMPSAHARELFLSDPGVSEAVGLWERIDAAVVGIGQPYATTKVRTAAEDSPIQELSNSVGDVARHYFDETGQVIDWDGEARMIAVSCAQLRAARTVIGVAVGQEKVSSIIGAARSGLITALVTDLRTAEAALSRLMSQSGEADAEKNISEENFS